MASGTEKWSRFPKLFCGNPLPVYRKYQAVFDRVVEYRQRLPPPVANLCRENLEPSATVYTSGAGTRLPRDCKWISSLEWVLLLGRGLEASGRLNESFWRAKTYGGDHAPNSFTSKNPLYSH